VYFIVITKLLDIPTTDPDDARRRKLLNVLLVGFAVLSLVGILIITFFIISGMDTLSEDLTALIACAVFLSGTVIIFAINRYWSGIIASSIFLVFLTTILIFSDTPQEVANGRALFFFALPIIIASVLLPSYASFIFAGVCSIAIMLVGMSISRPINMIVVIGFFAVALISWLSARSLEDALKGLRAINLNLDKLVEQKTEELAATLSRELILAGRNQAILDSIADGVVMFDANRVSILANPALSQIIETPIKDLMGINLADFINTKELSPTSQGTITGMIEHPEKAEMGVQVEWGKKTLAVSVARVQNSENNQTIGSVAVIRDITREAELEKMKSNFLAVVSHELRTPLNAIMGYAEMLKEAVYGTINEKQTSVTVRIMVNTQRLLTMVGDLLDEAQIKAGKLSLTKQLFKTSSLLDTMHATMDKITNDKGLTLTDEIDPNMPNTITGDARRLQQILINLVNNSAKFTEKGGIHACILRSDPNHWAIEVTDTGLGIPEEEIPYIFDTFRQVENSTIRKHGGFGLGLAIVKQLVELMKGEITVTSELGKGSTFIINLPLENNP